MWYCRHSEWCCGRACLSPCQENGTEKVRIGWYDVCPLSIVVFVFHWRKISHHIHQKTTKILIYEQLWRGWFSSCDYTGIKCRKTFRTKAIFAQFERTKGHCHVQFSWKSLSLKSACQDLKLVVVKLSQTLSSHICYKCQGEEKKQPLNKNYNHPVCRPFILKIILSIARSFCLLVRSLRMSTIYAIEKPFLLKKKKKNRRDHDKL